MYNLHVVLQKVCCCPWPSAQPARGLWSSGRQAQLTAKGWYRHSAARQWSSAQQGPRISWWRRGLPSPQSGATPPHESWTPPSSLVQPSMSDTPWPQEASPHLPGPCRRVTASEVHWWNRRCRSHSGSPQGTREHLPRLRLPSETAWLQPAAMPIASWACGRVLCFHTVSTGPWQKAAHRTSLIIHQLSIITSRRFFRILLFRCKPAAWACRLSRKSELCLQAGSCCQSQPLPLGFP